MKNAKRVRRAGDDEPRENQPRKPRRSESQTIREEAEQREVVGANPGLWVR